MIKERKFLTDEQTKQMIEYVSTNHLPSKWYLQRYLKNSFNILFAESSIDYLIEKNNLNIIKINRDTFIHILSEEEIVIINNYMDDTKYIHDCIVYIKNNFNKIVSQEKMKKILLDNKITFKTRHRSTRVEEQEIVESLVNELLQGNIKKPYPKNCTQFIKNNFNSQVNQNSVVDLIKRNSNLKELCKSDIKHLSTEDKIEIKRLYIVEEISTVDIAKKYEISTSHVLKIVNTGEKEKIKLKRGLSKHYEEIKKLYIDDELTLSEIAKRYNVSLSAVSKMFIRYIAEEDKVNISIDFSDNDILEIKRLYIEEGLSTAKIAKLYDSRYDYVYNNIIAKISKEDKNKKKKLTVTKSSKEREVFLLAEDKLEIKNQYINNISISDIAKYFNISVTSVYKVLRSDNLCILRGNSKLSSNDKVEMSRLYIEENATQKFLAEKYKVSIATIQKILGGQKKNKYTDDILTEELKLEIRNLYYKELYTIAKIAEMLNLTISQVVKAKKVSCREECLFESGLFEVQKHNRHIVKIIDRLSNIIHEYNADEFNQIDNHYRNPLVRKREGHTYTKLMDKELLKIIRK